MPDKAVPANPPSSGVSDAPKTWDTSETGRSNSSPLFFEIRSMIDRTIRGEAAALIAGHSEDVAHCILAGLTHGSFKMGPQQPDLYAALQAYVTLDEALSKAMGTDLETESQPYGAAKLALAKARGSVPQPQPTEPKTDTDSQEKHDG